mgnify:CR=1 FL=1
MVAFCSFSVLTTWPRVWIDEGKDIELARGFLNAGKLDIEMAPGQFSGVASLLQSTGYPVTVPLAGVFKLFGYGFEQARAYMLLWALIAIATVFFVSRKFLGNFNAIFSVLLIVTFASFYDSGRAVVGEIPGFVFLMAGLYFALYKDSYNKSGLFIGLSIVSKPSVFTWILPALVLVFAIEKKDFIIKTLKMSWGIILALFVWAILVLESLFSLSAWSGILNFYKNPYEGSSLISNFVTNLANAPYSTTLIYFGILFVVVIIARFLVEEKRLASLYNFIIIYGVFAFLYYLRSPGWLRYILIAELLILFILPHAVSLIVPKLKSYFVRFQFDNRYLVAVCLLALVVIQTVHLFTSADIFFSDSETKARDYVNKEFPTESVTVLNSVIMATMFDRQNRFMTLDDTVMREIEVRAGFKNIDIFSTSIMPEVVILSARAKKLPSEQEKVTLENKYQFVTKIGSYSIYKLTRQLPS